MTSRITICFLLINILTAFSSQAQVVRNFEDRVSYNVNGNITMIGNTLFTCASSVSNCQSIQNGTTSSSNGVDMVYVNVDPAAGYNNSSSATLNIPVGASVLHAELYWSGRHDAGASNRDRIRIKAPGSGTYTRVTAHTIDTFTAEGGSGSRPYQASADITQIVTNGGSGSYTVADLKAKTGSDSLGYYGGWAIAVVYQDNSQPFRRLMLFDGAAQVVGNSTVSITTDNLVTPYTGSFNTYIGALVWEGDQSITGDSFVFEGNTLSDSLNPANNFWNSSITAFNSRITNKNPDYVNQLAMDLVMTDVSGLLANGETQANIDFVTSGDHYFSHALAFVTDLYLPDFDSSMDKSATDLNGGQVEPGDVIEYRIAFENTGQDVAINTVVTDTLPNGVTYDPNSLEIVTASAGPAGAVTDASGDDAGEYDSNSNTVTFWVGNNAAPNQGGDFLPGESAVVKFWAVVDEQNSNSITNTARIDFNAQTNPNDPLLAEDEATINVVANASIEVLKTAQLSIDNGNPGTADAGDQITFSITVNNNGNLSMSNIALTDAMAPSGVNCPSTTLAAMSSMQCDDYTYNVSQNDMNTGGFIENTVNLTAIDGVGGNHQSSDSTQTAITLLAPNITSPVDGQLSNDNTPTVSGTGPVGAQIDVMTDQGGSCQATVNAQGTWSCDISPALTDGSVIISAFASDGGSNQSATDSVTIQIDATAPDAPAVNAPSNGQPISGTGEPGATVIVVTDNGDSCTAVVDGNGNWSCDLGPGVVHSDNITVTQTDEAGNVSPPTNIPGGIDTQAPGVSITAPVDGDLSNDNTPTVSGTSEADAVIRVTIGGVEVCSTVADSQGDWSCDVNPAVADGPVQIDVTAMDAAGNTSNPESVTITVDTMAPDAPAVNAPTNGQPISGTGEPGATVTVVTDNGDSCTAVVDGNGNWSCDLGPGVVHGDNITVTQTDEAGNVSPPTNISGGIDTQAPGVSITAPVDGDLSNDNTPTVSGTSEADAVIRVTIGGVEVCSTVADSQGDWSCDVNPAVADGPVQIDVTAMDAAGNTSNPESVTITVDTMAPDAPAVNAPTNGQPISGTGEPGATVTVVTDNGDSCTAVVDGNGNWSCDLGPGVVHGDNITVTQTDEAGNVSAPTVISGGIDTAPPANAVVTGISDDTGASGNDFITNDNTLTISGTAEADATVEVFVGGVSVGTTTADGSGNWTFDYTGIPLADGDYAITTVVTDVAGNDSGTSTAQTVRIDTTAPSAPIIIAPSNGAPVTGTGEPGATVHVTTPGGASCSTTVENDGSWSCYLSGTLVNGDDISATQTDEAGNESDPTTESGGLDTEAPAMPTIDTPINGSTINNASPTIGGTAEANSTVTVTNQNGPVCVAQTNANGDWSCVPDSPLADGLHQLQAVAKDAAGNESQPGSSQFTLNSGAGYTLVFEGIDNLVTTETGGSDTFTIALPLTPSADVTVNLSSSDTTEGTVSPASVTFTTANWNQPVEITVTGVDDQVYDQDQPYTIDFSNLSSADSNYNGVAINSIDVINEDDDAQPDLSVFITNCIDGSLPQQPVSYYLTVSNEGNTDIQGARVTTVLPTNISGNGWQWDCVDQNGQACQRATGQGDLDELIDLNSNESMLFTFVADVQGELHDFIDAASNIELPMGETDVNPNNNQAQDSDLLYQFLFKDGFECAAPGTIETTNQQLEQLLNLSY